MQSRFRALLLLLLGVTSSVFAAAPKDPPAAPIPAQILTAKKLFLAQGVNEYSASSIPDRHIYDQFYALLKDQGKFVLVSSPSEADLTLEIQNRIVAVRSIPVKDGSEVELQPQLSLVLRDPHTQALLWTLTERYDRALRDANKRKDLDQNLDLLLADFLKLRGAQAPAPVQP